jgi:hypothetical protein
MSGFLEVACMKGPTVEDCERALPLPRDKYPPWVLCKLREHLYALEMGGTSWYKATTLDEMEAFYWFVLPRIRYSAYLAGYAIGVHGSCRRDFDLMAMPWREGYSDVDTLAHAIAIAACGITRDGPYQWEQKPAGRIATSIPICWTSWHNMIGAGHIDLSVSGIGSSE